MNAPLVESAIQPMAEAQDQFPDQIDKRLATIVILLIASVLFIARTSLIPYLWIAIAAVIMLSYAAVISKREGFRALWVNLAIIVFTFGAIEGYFWTQGPLERQMEYSEEFFVADDVLGYKPAEDKRIGHRSYGGDRLLYEVTYTLDNQGLRIASPLTSKHETLPCIAFFGDSFTFGEGMADEETMPYQVWKHMGPRYQATNFAFLGYGPHQMLATLEQGQLESRGHCQPSHIIYQAIPSHVSRAAGLEAWDHHGPRYAWQSDGQVRQEGHFDDLRPSTPLQWLRLAHWQFPARVRTWLEESAVYRTILNSHRPVTPEDVALFAAIVNAAKSTASQKYPDVTFQVLFWDYDDDVDVGEQVQSQLQARNITVHPMSTILPGFPTERARYEISPYDRHPNALAHTLIADYVAKKVVRSSLTADNSRSGDVHKSL
ncbi:MAG TPA: hypothetical protein VKB81_01915 [Nitrospira sp.]|nr:hypothetical protein [Nitrospira sp.]